MLSSVRIKCGLGNPPEPYTQNANESINSMIKRSKESGKLTLKQTVKLMQDEVKTQEEKVKLALIKKGELFDTLFLNYFSLNQKIFIAIVLLR